jgi:hypothetical protein
MKKQTTTTDNAKANLSAKNDSAIVQLISRERKYLSVDYSAKDGGKKQRGAIRSKLFSFVNSFIVAERMGNKEKMESTKKAFAEFAKATYVNVDYKDSSIFFNGTGRESEAKRMELQSLLSAMHKG